AAHCRVRTALRSVAIAHHLAGTVEQYLDTASARGGARARADTPSDRDTGDQGWRASARVVGCGRELHRDVPACDTCH
ncbi:hypothetical protein ACSTH7_25480, partial [Vibrio parahaemolyticus]